MWEDFVCTFKADILHDPKEFVKELVFFYLPLVESSSKCVELREILVCEQIF